MLVRARGGKTQIPTGWCVPGGACKFVCKRVEEAVHGVGPDPVRHEDPLLAKPVTRGGRILPRTAVLWDRGGSGERSARHEPVSYTHLDVYKRQRHDLPRPGLYEVTSHNYD